MDGRILPSLHVNQSFHLMDLERAKGQTREQKGGLQDGRQDSFNREPLQTVRSLAFMDHGSSRGWAIRQHLTNCDFYPFAIRNCVRQILRPQ